MKHIFLNKMYDYESLEISPANKDEVTPEAILEKHNVIYFSKYNDSFLFSGDLLPSEMFERLIPAMKEYATMQAARAWDACYNHLVEEANSDAKPDIHPNKEEYLKQVK